MTAPTLARPAAAAFPAAVIVSQLPAATVPVDLVPAQRSTSGSVDFPARPSSDHPAYEMWTLVERAQYGDSAAMGQIYDRNVDMVFRFIASRVRQRQTAEDLTSDVFLRAVKRIGSFTWQGRDIAAWLLTIARNVVTDHYKCGRVRLEVSCDDVYAADQPELGLEGSPEDTTVDHIRNLALLGAIQRLSKPQRECIELRFLQDRSVKETAAVLGKTPGAVKALQHRAVLQLAKFLPDGFEA